MIADIANGHTTLADWLFLIAAILFALGAVVSYVTGASTAPVGRSPGRYVTPGALAALALIAVAWMVL
jgi:hypothetical protein